MKIALMGAGGKMGCRISDNLKGNAEYCLSHVEIGEAGKARLSERGIMTVPQDKAIADADIVVLAIPDVLIGKVTHEIVPKLRSDTLVVGLDPAAAYAGVMPDRADLTFFVCHPTHPPLFNDETDPRAQRDWFGGIAKQDAVCAIFKGSDEQYAIGDRLTREMFKPIARTYRITVEQMAILEPALVETLSSTLIEAMRQAFDKAIEMGVPRDAALAFFLGHARIQFAVLFGLADSKFSDGAKLAMKQARDVIFKPDWMTNIMNLESVRKSVGSITRGIQVK